MDDKEPGKGVVSEALGQARLPEEDLAAQVMLARVRRALTGRGDAPRVDRFTILEQIGSGGMGTVYAAHDPKLERRVALKLVSTGSDADRRRVLREARALARLSHPNVVAVYDADVLGDEVYIAMELVEGRNLRVWLEERDRTWREMTALLLQAARGLAAAHEAGIVHGDFKPENVLVDRSGCARVVDFGLARFVEEAAGELEGGANSEIAADTRTRERGGTPAYMAPEQLANHPATPATDQFSFCVTLYEALQGTRPFQADSVADLAAAMKDGPGPAPPRRGPRWLRRLLEIGLSRRAAGRHPAMSALVDEIERRLDGRRLRRVTLAGGLVLSAAAAAAGVLAWGDREPTRCRAGEARLAEAWDQEVGRGMRDAFLATGRPQAEESYRRVAARLDHYGRQWTAMYVEACQATHLHGDQSEAILDRRMGCLSRRLHRFGALVEALRDPDPELVDRAVDAVYGLAPVADCADRVALAAEEEALAPAEVRAEVASAREQLERARGLELAGRYREALALAEPLARTPAAPGRERVLADAHLLSGSLKERLDALDDAAEEIRRGLLLAAESSDPKLQARLWAERIRIVGYHNKQFDEALEWAQYATALARGSGSEPLLADVLETTASVRFEKGDYRAAEAEIREALAIRRRAGPEASPHIAAGKSRLGLILQELGRQTEAHESFERAVVLAEEVFGPDHPTVADTVSSLGSSHLRAGDYAAAAEAHARALAINERTFGAKARRTASAHINLGNALWRQGDHAGAREAMERALDTLGHLLGDDHVELAVVLNNLGGIEAELGLLEPAERRLRRALELRLRGLPEDHPLTATSFTNLGALLALQGNHREALVELSRALERLEARFGPDHPGLGINLVNQGDSLRALGELEAALRVHRRAARIMEASLGTKHVRTAYAQQGIGLDLLALGRPREAVAPLTHAHQLRASSGSEDPVLLAETEFALARALWAGRDDRARALELAERARERLEAAGARAEATRRELAEWLERAGR